MSGLALIVQCLFWRRPGSLCCACLASGLIGLSVLHAMADDLLLINPGGEIRFETAEPPAIAIPKPDPAYHKILTAAERRKAEHEEALRRLNDAMVVSAERQKELGDSVVALDQDRNALVDALIVTARSIRNLEDALDTTEAKLANLASEEMRIEKSLSQRRAVLGEVLAALQRMGQNPPPAIVVSADDALQSVRSAILLGSVLPELKSEAEALVADLQALKDVKQSTRDQQEALIVQEQTLSEEQLRLDLLIKENQKLRVNSDEKLARERSAVTELTADASTLRDLISDITSEIDNVTKEVSEAEASARKSAELARAAFEEKRLREVAALSSLRPVDPVALDSPSPAPGLAIAYRDARDGLPSGTEEPKRVVDFSAVLLDTDAQGFGKSFTSMKGNLDYPANGTILSDYGGDDGLGGVSQGLTLRTRAKAPVVTPVSGHVVFAGPFPGFEQVLILDVGEGYHIVMAGMATMNAGIGDWVKAGEVVAIMGGERLARLAGLSSDVAATLEGNFSGSQKQPVLYVEFRKDGTSINSMPWWAKT